MAGDEVTEIYEEGDDSMDHMNNEAELENGGGGEEKVLHFLDSLDDYLTLMDSLNSKLREIKREREKSLSVFGGLVSPKLRSAQLSFETALETLVEIANTRSSILSAFEHITKK